MLKILQARIQNHMNQELPDVQAGFREGRGSRDQIANMGTTNSMDMSLRKLQGMVKVGFRKNREFQKNI